MAVRDTEILEVLQANYQKAIESMPPELAEEFQRRIITPDDLKSYAKSIMLAVQFSNMNACLAIQNRMVEQFNFRGFGARLKKHDVDPVKVYEQLLHGFFDYK